MKPTHLLLLALLALSAFGGSFECSGSSHSDDTTVVVTSNKTTTPPGTPVTPAK